MSGKKNLEAFAKLLGLTDDSKKVAESNKMLSEHFKKLEPMIKSLQLSNDSPIMQTLTKQQLQIADSPGMKQLIDLNKNFADTFRYLSSEDKQEMEENVGSVLEESDEEKIKYHMDKIHELMKKDENANFQTQWECADHFRWKTDQGAFNSYDDAYRFAIEHCKVKGKNIKHLTIQHLQEALRKARKQTWKHDRLKSLPKDYTEN